MPEKPDEILQSENHGKVKKPESGKVNLALMFGFAGSDGGSKPDSAKPSAQKPREKKDTQDAEQLLTQWPEKTPDQAKEEFMSNAENLLAATKNMETSCEFNGVKESYTFSSGPRFLVNGQPADLKSIRGSLKSGEISTAQISFDMKMEKIDGQNSNPMKIAINVNDFLNGGIKNVRQRLGSLVQTIYGAAHQGGRNLEREQRNRMLTMSASEEQFRANRALADQLKSAAAGKECNVVEFNNPESRETLIIIDIQRKNANKPFPGGRGVIEPPRE